MAKAAPRTVYVLNGPNLNLLGTRDPAIYGTATLADVEKLCRKTAEDFGLRADCRQSNREGELVEFIHEAKSKGGVGIIMNGGAYSHTSIAIHDAITGVQLPTIEVHISNVYARESFRHHSFIARAAIGSIAGFGIDSYRLAMIGLASKLGVTAKA